MNSDLEFKLAEPDPAHADFVESYWMLANHSTTDKEIVVLPNGSIDISFSYSPAEPFHIMLMGLESEPQQTVFPAGTVIHAISFKLPAIEYVLDKPVPELLNTGRRLPGNFWGFNADDVSSFDRFVKKASSVVAGLIQEKIDPRKHKLFDLLYSSDGSLSVQQLADQVYWSSRQINRYFNQQFGISLKAYNNILRFRASFAQLKAGRLFPEQQYTDQAHFIRDVKKYAGVVPKELSRNKNDRFIQLSALPGK